MSVATRPSRPLDRPDARPAPIIEAIDIGHVFQGRDQVAVQAIDQIDLRVEAGELVALLGPSGCGKSTLLRIVSGLIPPTRGAVSLAGAPPAAARTAQGIGWLA